MTDEWLADPAMRPARCADVFGDGGHPSTLLAAVGLARELCRRRRGARILDVGCGSGVLSRLAASLGADVFAVDRFAPAVAMTRKRVASAVVVCGRWQDMTEADFDVVIANLPEPELTKSLSALLRAGGALLVTGFLTSRAHAIAARLDATPTCAFRGYALLRKVRGTVSEL